MSAGLGNCRKILHIVRLRQMLRRWRHKAAVSSRRVPPDVPAGHVAVCVGSSRRRFIVRATHLNHPIIKFLLGQAEEEYGFSNPAGPLSIPCCDESLFEEILRFLSRSGSAGGRFLSLEDFRCHAGVVTGISESRPLLSEKSVW